MAFELRNSVAIALAVVAVLAGAFVCFQSMGGAPAPPPVAPSARPVPHPAAAPVREDAAPLPEAETPPTAEGAPPIRVRIVGDDHVEEPAVSGRTSQEAELRALWAASLWAEHRQSNPWQLEGSGTLRASYPDGAPMLEGRFVDGKPEGPWTRWHPDGRLASTSTYQHGELHGDQVQYHRNGLVAERKTYDGGRPEGQSAAWYESGQVREQGAYVAGSRHGTWRWYDEQGQLVREERWQSGARIGPITLFETAGGPAADQARERRASMDGRYSQLLRRIAAPDDRANYGELHDYGYYQPLGEYLGETAVPAGYWVYVSPYWYVWGQRR
jgi:hypothetical protein